MAARGLGLGPPDIIHLRYRAICKTDDMGIVNHRRPCGPQIEWENLASDLPEAGDVAVPAYWTPMRSKGTQRAGAIFCGK